MVIKRGLKNSNEFTKYFGTFLVIVVVLAGIVFGVNQLTGNATNTGTKVLVVTNNNPSGGEINSNPPGIDHCVGICDHYFSSNSLVGLDAQAYSGWVFGKWNGQGTGSSTSYTRTFSMNDNKVVSATFYPLVSVLPSGVVGDGQGTVTSINEGPAGRINCGANCVKPFVYDGAVTLKAEASTSSGSIFAGWVNPSGYGYTDAVCVDSQSITCIFYMDGPHHAIPKFVKSTHNLNVVLDPASGGGSFITSPSGTSCGTNCLKFNSMDLVSITPAPAPGYVLDSWGGACSGTPSSESCGLEMSEHRIVTLKFIQGYQVKVIKSGTGGGVVASVGGVINCGPEVGCSKGFASGATVKLSAIANSDSFVASWSGVICQEGTITPSVSSTCTFVVNGAKNVAVVFTKRYSLTVSKTGTGSGTVKTLTNNFPDDKINCGSTCIAQNMYVPAAQITLKAEPSPATATVPASVFVGWSGGCSGTTNPCTFNIFGDTTITAKFDIPPTPTPPVLSATALSDSQIKLSWTATPGATSYQIWRSPPASNPSILINTVPGGTFTMYTDTLGLSASSTYYYRVKAIVSGGSSYSSNIASATTLSLYLLNVTKLAVNGGTVTSGPAGINCGSTCGYQFAQGTKVLLTATPASGYVLTGWEGCDTPSSGNTCTVTMSAAKNVKVFFALSNSCPCNSPNYPSVLTVTGWESFPSSLPGCSITLPKKWDGKLTKSGANSCSWTTTLPVIISSSSGSSGSVSGTSINYGLSLTLNPSTCSWGIGISTTNVACVATGYGQTFTIWGGQKSATGSDPRGSYSRNAGVVSTNSLAVSS